MSPNSLRSDCRKFAPNIFNKTKCSNCFKQKEEHTAEALECNRAMRKVAKSGYLFVAPGWDFSIPLNRTKRWQRRWFVLYDDGELNYSVDEHPDTVPQASIDMTQVLEVAGAEEVTGHAFSLAITAPDRVTFVKAIARDEARAWTSVLAVYTRNKGRHKRNATFPGGQTTTIHQTETQPRSGTPNPIRPRYNSCHSESSLRPGTRWNQDTTSLPASIITPTANTSISKSSSSSSCRSTGYRDQPPSSASPPTRDKLNSEEKAAVRRTRQQQNTPNIISMPLPASSDCPDGPIQANIPDYETSSKRLETLHHIATVLTRPRVTLPSAHPPPTRDSDTDSTPGPSAIVPALERVELPAETLLHLKKGWLMLKEQQNDWFKLWFVLCGTNLTAYKDPKLEDQADFAVMTIVLSQVANVTEIQVQRNYGFQIRLWNDTIHTLSAVTAGIRNNWLCSIRRAAGLDDLPPRPVTTTNISNSNNNSNTSIQSPITSVTPTAARLMLLSSDEEYRTASEGGRRESGEWTPASPPLTRTPISRVKERARSRSNRSSPSSRASTLDSVSTDELLAADELQRLHVTLQRTEHDKLTCLNQLKEKSDILNETLVKYEVLNRDYQSKQHANVSLQEELSCVNERLRRGIEENDYLYKKLQELEGKELHKHNSYGSLSDLTNVELDLDFNTITKDTLMDEYNNLRSRFEKAVQEIRAMKRELRNSNLKYDDLELNNITLKQDLKQLEENNHAQNTMMAARIQDLTTKLTSSEKQVRNLKSKLQDSREKRRSLSLKGKESFSINKEVEDKITELEVKILSLESSNKRNVTKPTKKVIKRDRSSERSSPIDERTQRRLRRKSLDSATTSEPMKVLIRLSSLESKVNSICDIKPIINDENLATSTESLNLSNQDLKSESNSRILALESTIEAAKMKLNECLEQFQVFKHARRPEDRLTTLEQSFHEIANILKSCNCVSPAEVNVISDSVLNIVQSFESLLNNKLKELAKTRRTLRDTGKLTPQISMSILAEKLAYESVLISRIHEALNTVHSDDTRFTSRILRREILETGQLIQQLQAKLSGTLKSSIPRFTGEHLTKILTRHLIHVNYITNNKQVYDQQHDHHHQDVNKGLQYLLIKQKDINKELQKYKTGKLEQLAYSLAVETLNYASDTDCRLDKQGLEDIHLHEAWQLAQEKVSAELIQTEISQILNRVAQSYIPDTNDTFFTLWAAERAALELWGDVVEERLQEELDQTTAEIRTSVDTALTKLRPATPWRRRLELERRTYPNHTHNTSRTLLAEFADIMAHKALIDARIAVFQGEIINPIKCENKIDSTLLKNLIEDENYLLFFEESNIVNETQLVEAEFQTVYLKCYQAATNETQNSPVNITLVEALKGLDEEVSRLQGAQSSEGMTIQSWNDVTERCSELHQKLVKVPITTRACSQCQHLKDSLHRLSREHSAELAVHESSQAQLREHTRQLEHRLGTLDSEYAKQLEQLRAAYRDTLTTPPITPGLGNDATDSLRARYQAEIEQLRALCEKGLAAVESTHRRVVAELQDKHRREREQLLEEKEQALAEETQATLAALDAMRKAHEHEVRREVGKFKADFLRKLQATHDLGALHQEHEAEMREIKAEILTLSERYSVKCVESASLEEQLCSVHQQLAHAHKHIQQLDKRNKQLAEAVATAAVATAASTDDTYHLHRIRNPQLSSLQANISVLSWLLLVLALCVSTFGANCVVAIVLGFLTFLIGLLTILYIQSGNFEDVYFSCNLLNNPLAVQEIPSGGLSKIVENIKKPKLSQKTDQRVTGSDLIDSSLQEIFGYITRDYVQPWYSLISTNNEFLENGIRKSAQALAIHISNRVKEIDWLPYLTTRLVDDAATQLRLFRNARAHLVSTTSPRISPKHQQQRHRRNKSDTDAVLGDSIEQHFFTLESEEAPGRGAVCTDTNREAVFLTSLAELLLYVLLPDQDFRCAPLRALLCQLSSRCLLRPLADLVTDPDTINNALLWLCVRDGSLSSDVFLTALRLTDDLGELRYTRDLVTRELQQLRGRDATSGDAAIKQQIGSLQYVARLIDTRLSVLNNSTPGTLNVLPASTVLHLSLETILKNNVTLSYFIDYVTGIGQQSELFFYLAAEGWRVAAEQQLASIALGEAVDLSLLRDSARRLYSQYLPELRAPAVILRNLHQSIHDLGEVPSERWFDELQRHVHELLRGLVPGFTRSEGYAKLLAELDLVHVTDEDVVQVQPVRHAKHARSYSDITCTGTANVMEATIATIPSKSESHQFLTVPSIAINTTDESEEDYAKLKVGNYTLKVDIIEAGVMSDKGKTFGIYATQVSKLYDSGFLEQWHIYRRYSDFHELHTRIRERWSDLSRLPFPGKKPFQTAERALLERRMRALNSYMEALCRRHTLDAHPGLRTLLLTFTDHDSADYTRPKLDNKPLIVEEGDNNIPLRVLLTLADEVFDLRSRNQWLRRRLVTLLRQIVRAWFGDIVSRRIVEWVAGSTSPKNVARGLKGLQRAMWPGGVRAPARPRRSPSARARTRLAAKVALLAAPALTDELQRLLGQDTTRQGLLTVFELVQRPTLTRRLLYVLLEGALVHLMPEKPVAIVFKQLYAAAATNN